MHKITDEFADPEFIAQNQPFFDRYVDMRVHGHDSKQAFLHVFGAEHWNENQHGYRRIDEIESTAYYTEQFAAKLKTIPVGDLWDSKKALNALLTNVRSPYVKDATRLAAIKELNILVGIVIVDENGKTKAGRSLADFYAQSTPLPAITENETSNEA